MAQMKTKKEQRGAANLRLQEGFDRLRNFLRDRAEGFKRVLPEKSTTVDRFVATVMFNVYRTPELIECSMTSIFQAAMSAAKLGLEPDAILGHAYLVPFADKSRSDGLKVATLIVGYRGMAALAWRDAKILLHGSVVRARDTWKWRDGLDQLLEHDPSQEDEPGERVAAWIVAVLPDGRKIPRWCPRREVLAAKAQSKGSDNASSPWKLNPDSMWLKTPVRRMWPFLPISTEVGRTIEAVEAGAPIVEAMEFDDAGGAGAMGGAAPAADSGEGALKDATEAMRGARGRGLPEPAEQTTVADVIGPDKERVPAKQVAAATAAKAAPFDAAKARFFDLLTTVKAERWPGIFTAAGVAAPQKITGAWIDSQDAETLGKLSEVAEKHA